MRLLAHLLNRFIRNGKLRLIAANGSVYSFGGYGPGPAVTARLHDSRLYTRLFLNPELHAGEAYMNGTLTFEDGSDVGDFMALFAVNRGGLAAQRVAPDRQRMPMELRTGMDSPVCAGRPS